MGVQTGSSPLGTNEPWDSPELKAGGAEDADWAAECSRTAWCAIWSPVLGNRQRKLPPVCSHQADVCSVCPPPPCSGSCSSSQLQQQCWIVAGLCVPLSAALISVLAHLPTSPVDMKAQQEEAVRRVWGLWMHPAASAALETLCSLPSAMAGQSDLA